MSLHDEYTIKGYQFSPVDGKFTGEYDFPANKDQYDIHMPPFTTLVAPPALPQYHSAYWDGVSWTVTYDATLEPPYSPVEDYAMVTDEYIAYLQSIGKWTSEDQRLRDEALSQNNGEIVNG